MTRDSDHSAPQDDSQLLPLHIQSDSESEGISADKSPNEAKKPELAASSTENPWVETVKTVVLSVVLALGIRTFVAEPRWIPSGSMEPTLQIDDRLIVDKVTYRLQLPQRGDVIVFNPTDTLKQQKFKDAFIKRVIGLPGETVEVAGGRVFINGKPLEEDYLDEEPSYQWGPKEVPEGQYLVLGDNRNNSYDSHYWGFVPRDRIIGRAIVRFWPPQRVGQLKNPYSESNDSNQSDVNSPGAN